MTPEDIENEKSNLRKMSSITIVDYIKSSIDTLIRLKVEEKMVTERKKISENSINPNIVKSNYTYEKIIRELEMSLKTSLKNEQTLKHQLEEMTMKYDILEKKSGKSRSISKGFNRESNRTSTSINSNKNSNRNSKSNNHNNHGSATAHTSRTPINYNFNNPIVIYGNRNFGKYVKEDQDTVNVSIF